MTDSLVRLAEKHMWKICYRGQKLLVNGILSKFKTSNLEETKKKGTHKFAENADNILINHIQSSNLIFKWTDLKWPFAFGDELNK